MVLCPEDFERKLHRKRNKVGVRFVELTDTIPVQGPESEVVGSLVTNDFLATLDTRNRRIGEPPRFRIPDPIRSGPERRMIYARTA